MENSLSTNMIKRMALLAATVSSFLTPFMGSAINIALPSIGEEFELDAVVLAWVSTSFLVAAAVFLVPLGKMADIYGRKRIFTYGVLIFTLSSLVSAFSTSATMLILSRILQGIGGAMIFGTGVAILSSVFPPGERGRALGISVAATYLGLSLGPFLGGFLTQHFGWRSIFLVNVPLGLVVAACIWKLKGEWAEAKGEGFDVAGSMIYGLALTATMYGLTLLPALSGIWVILVGVVGISAFIMWEARVKSPVLNIHLFRHNASFTFSNLAALINYSATFAVGFLLSLYLQYTRGLSPLYAGLILVSQPVVMVMVSPLAGRLSDRVEPRVVASIGMALTTIGLVLLAFLGENTALQFVLVALIVLGFGFGLFSSPNTNAVMSSVEKRFYGVASGTLGTMRLIGQMLSMGIAMLIFSIYIGRVQITPEYHAQLVSSLRTASAVFAVLCFAGIFASLARGKVRQNLPVEGARDG